MGDESGPRALAAAFAAAEAWWREAGVEWAYADAPRDWLAAAPAKAAPQTPARAASPAARSAATPPPPPPLGGDPAGWPTELAAWNGWWLGEPSLAPPGARRVPARGPGGAPLMVLVPQPEAEDGERLLAGPQGRLLAALLAALGLDDDAVYCAGAVPSHLGLLDWELLAERGLGAVLVRHVTLAAPERLLVLDRQGVSSLLGHDPAQAGAGLTLSLGDGRSLPVAYAPSLAALLDKPARKAAVWRMLLEWTGT